VKKLPEIQAAIEKLSRQKFWKLAKWLDQRKEDVWDREIEEDSRPGGPLDKLAEKAMEEHEAGLTVPLEEALRRTRKPARRPQPSRRRPRPTVRVAAPR
jgi:hypothetical protein